MEEIGLSQQEKDKLMEVMEKARVCNAQMFTHTSTTIDVYIIGQNSSLVVNVFLYGQIHCMRKSFVPLGRDPVVFCVHTIHKVLLFIDTQTQSVIFTVIYNSVHLFTVNRGTCLYIP